MRHTNRCMHTRTHTHAHARAHAHKRTHTHTHTMSAVDGRATIEYFVGNDRLHWRPNRKSSARREQANKQTNKHASKQLSKQTKKQTSEQANTQTNKEASKQAKCAAPTGLRAGAVDQPAPARRLHARPADGRDAPPRRRPTWSTGSRSFPLPPGLYSPHLPSAAVRRLLRACICM